MDRDAIGMLIADLMLLALAVQLVCANLRPVVGPAELILTAPAAVCATDADCARLDGAGDPEPVVTWTRDPWTGKI